MVKRKLRMGMIGGGPGAFIGAVHRMAANLDGMIELACGAFSSDPGKSEQQGRELLLDPSRVYSSYQDMIRQEASLPADRRMDFVSIVTPNHLHFDAARLSLEHGFDVVMDKPMTITLDEAIQLKKMVEANNRSFCLTHTYTGYPMVKEAREQVLSGKFGKVRKIFVEYPQGWLSNFLESSEQKQASWRTDPGKSGMSGAMGDIGTHAFNLAEYVSGLQVENLCCDLNILVPGRKLDDDGAVLLKFTNGASGVLFASQVAAGEENNIRVRVYGEKGGIEWQQKDANSLVVKWLDKPAETWRAGTEYLGSIAKHNCRLPAGHPEGYIEAFANHYRNFTLTVIAKMNGEEAKREWMDYPGVEDGLRGMQFIDAVIKSSTSEKKWVKFGM